MEFWFFVMLLFSSFHNSLNLVCSILFLALASALYLPVMGKGIGYGSSQGGLDWGACARFDKCWRLKPWIMIGLTKGEVERISLAVDE